MQNSDALDQEINGAAVTVRIRGTERPLRYALFAVVLYKQLTGDSLFVPANFTKIELTSDPDRWMKCLWAGLHELQPDGKSWKAPFTLEELGALVDFSNAAEISVQMVKALTQSMPKPRKESDDPKVAPPPSAEDLSQAAVNQPSSGSTLELVADSELLATNS
jgi:hypothetical protein